MTQSQFQAGIGRCTINPPLSAPHAGWGAQTHLFPDGIESDLWATVLLVSDGSETVALVEVDLVIISRDESDAIRRAVSDAIDIPFENVRAAVSHNHAGPPPSSWNWMPEGREALQVYYASLPANVSGAAMAAKRNLQPAHFGVSWGSSTVAVNRREISPDGRMVTGVNPDGAIDPAVLVGRIDAQNGSPIAAVVGYTMHPTVMGPGNRLVSPDWPGHLKRTVESVTGATCLFVQGATGDIGPGPDGFTDDLAVIRRLGAAVGSEAARCYWEHQLPPRDYRHERVWESGAPLGKWTWDAKPFEPVVVAAHSTSIELPLRPQPDVDVVTQELNEAQDQLTSLIERGAPEDEIEAATFVVKRANMTLGRATTFGGRDTFPVDVHVVRVGPLVIIGCEGEPFSQIAKDIRERSPFTDTWFGGYTGGWFGYIPTPDAFPKGGYEVETSPYTEDAAGVLVDGVVQFLNDLYAAE